jgi:hypothetical protein
MAATGKYLYRDSTSGQVQEAPPISVSVGAADAGLIPVLNASGYLDSSFLPPGIVPDTYNANASGSISVGDMVYVTSGGLIARASAAVAGNPAMGYSLTAVTTGNPAVMYCDGRNTGVSGLTIGARYYLSAATPGAITATPVSAAGAGSLHQYVGTAISATVLDFDRIQDAIVLAS